MPEKIYSKTLTLLDPNALYTGDDQCEDCPDVNLDPPSRSECPYFEIRSGIAVCNREGSTQRQLDRIIGPPGLGGLACSEPNTEI